MIDKFIALTDKNKRKINLITSLVMLIMSLLLVALFMCGTLTVRGDTLNVESFLVWVFGLADIFKAGFGITVLKLLLAVLYCIILIVCIVRLVNIVKKLFLQLKKDITDTDVLHATSVIYDNTKDTVFVIACYLFGCMFIYDSELWLPIKVAVIIFIILTVILRALLNYMEKEHSKSIDIDVINLAETLIAVTCMMVLVEIIIAPVMQNFLNGIRMLSGISEGTNDAVIFNSIVRNIVEPFMVFLMIFKCRTILKYSIEKGRHQQMHWEIRYAFKMLIIFLCIGYVAVCFADSFIVVKVSEVYKHTNTIIANAFAIGKDYYLPLILLASAGMLATSVEPTLLKRKSVKAENQVNSETAESEKNTDTDDSQESADIATETENTAAEQK